MILYKLDNAAARQILSSRALDEAILWPSMEKNVVGDERELNEGSLKALNEKLIEVIGTASGGESERALVRDVRETIQVSAPVAADAGFWRWLTVKYFFEAVQARHGAENELAKEANFGIGGKFEGLIARIWFRAEVAYDKSAPDPYWLARRGDQDFWRSHVLRVRYSNARIFVRELVKYQYPDDEEGPRLHASGKDGIRTLVKRIQAFHACSALEMASSEQVPPILEHLSVNLVAGVRA